MPAWSIALIVIAAVAAAVFLILLTVAALSENFVFGKRSDKNPLLKYFTAEDFGLTCEKFPLGQLCGCIYRNAAVQSREEVIVFVHGMGPGHVAYTTEIAYFCNLGYTVVAVDSLGCNMSSGKNMKGMYEGVKTVITATDFSKRKFAGSKIYLVGHSWGGYSVLCASKELKVDGVVAIAAPDSPAKTMASGAAPLIGKPLATVLRPFWRIINFFKFGVKGNAGAGKCASGNGTPTLLIHGDCDVIVNLKCCAYKTAKGAHISKYLAKGKAHNPYNTSAAEAKLAELSATLLKSRKMTEEEVKAYFSSFDFSAATEEDPEVMQYIANFISDVKK